MKNMKRKYLAICLSLVMCMCLLAGCGSSSDSTSSTTNEGTIYGEITEVGDDSITIEVGTLNEDSDDQDDGESTDSTEEAETVQDNGSGETLTAVQLSTNSESAGIVQLSDTDSSDEETDSSDADSGDIENGGADGDAPEIPSGENGGADGDAPEIPSGENGDMGGGSFGGSDSSVSLDKTGETQEITITDDTTITMSTGGSGGMGGSGADAGMSGMGGEMPDGAEMSSEMPDMSEMSSEMPDMSEMSSEMPDMSEMGSEMPDMSEMGSEMPDGGGGQPGGNGSDNAGGSDDSSTGSDNEEMTFSISDLSVGMIVSVEFDSDGNAETITVLSMGTDSDMASMGDGAGGGDGQDMSGNSGQPGGSSSSGGVDSYDAVEEYTSDTEVSGETVSSTGTDENALHIYEGAVVSFSNMTITRVSSDSTGGDNSSFYGVGAAVLCSDGTTYISGGTVDTDAAGGAGVFAYDSGTIYIADTQITTAQDTSGGIHAAGGGTLYAWDLTVETQGESSAAIRSDRGGGTMVVDGGTYTSNGTGSPAVYCTADIVVNDATLISNNSEAICIEGLNTLRLFDCDLTGSMQDSDQNDCTWNIILYQSMSGDSEVGNSIFEMNGGTLKAENGGMFYTTNTESTFILKDVDITYASDSDFFLRCTGNANERGWGTTGENGADCSFTAIDQEMEGDVIWDSISQLDFYMTDGSELTGAFVVDDTYANGNSGGYCNVYIESGCTWTVTGDSTITALDCAGTIVDEDGNTVTITGSDGTVYVEGTSSYTITVDSYTTNGDVSGASEATDWEDYEVEKPSSL